MSSGRRLADAHSSDGPSRAEVEDQLGRLLASESFFGAQRSSAFLDFVVTETLAGRQDRLGGYTVGVEVFGRPDDFDSQADPIVRVEAGRLRRRLERYYLTEGAGDTVSIEVPKGGYVASFAYRGTVTGPSAIPAPDVDSSDAGPRATRWSWPPIGVALALLIALLVWLTWRQYDSEPDGVPTTDPEVLALYEQARDLRDPPLDPVLRWRLVEAAYREVIERDPDFPGGYAGLAFVLSVRSWWGLSSNLEADAREAVEAGRLAVGKSPRSGWAHVTLGMALNLQGDHDSSLAAARRAVELSPDNAEAVSLAGLLYAFAGQVEEAVLLTREAVQMDPVSLRTPYRNIAGVVLFHAGLFAEALEFLVENQRLGGPDGPHVAWYRAAAMARLGRKEEARAEVARARAMPYEITPEQFITAFRDPSEGRELTSALELIGD